MELRHLQYVVELDRTRSLTRAAANLGVAQPAISQGITALEREFSVILFDRTSRPVQPTLAGTMFIQGAMLVLEQVEQLRITTQEHSTLLRGRITIGTVYAFGQMILPRLIAEFHKLFPGVEFVIRRDQMKQLIDAVRTNTVDLAFVDSPDVLGNPDLHFTPVQRDEIAVATSLEHRLAKSAHLRFEDLREEPFIAYEAESSLHEPLIRAAKAAGFIPQIVASTQSQLIARSLVSAGVGVSIGTKVFLESPGLPVATIALMPPMTKDTMLVARGGAEPNPVTRPFLEFVRERLIVVS